MLVLVHTIDKTVGVNSGTTIEVTPSEAMPDGLTARFAYSKDADGGNVNDKAAGGDDQVQR